MRVLGIDYGRVRLGLALSDDDGVLASPLPARRRARLDQDLDSLADLVTERQVGQVVVGLPKNMNGSLGEMALEAATFARALEERLVVPVISFDERLTTREAERVLVEADLSRARRRTLRDSLAAVLILQAYLEARRAGEPGPTAEADSG
jgi:putative Holliday junction resolvase